MAADMSLVVGLCAFDARRTYAARAAPAGRNQLYPHPRFQLLSTVGFELGCQAGKR
jgi:hypothetical protein